MEKKRLSKGYIAGIVVVVIIFVLLIFGMFKLHKLNAEADIYKAENQIVGKDILTKPGKNIYYFYQPTCGHCEEVKPDITKFTAGIKDSDINFYVVDMSMGVNNDYWYQGENYQTDPDYKKNEDIHTAKDVQIVGTPTMIYADGQKVISQEIGNGIYTTMNLVLEDTGVELRLSSKEAKAQQ